jgi:hypothetical protein
METAVAVALPFVPAGSDIVTVAVPVWLLLVNMNVVCPPAKEFVAVAPPPPEPLTEPIVAGVTDAVTCTPSFSIVPSCFVTVTVSVLKPFVVIEVDDALIDIVSLGVGWNAP